MTFCVPSSCISWEDFAADVALPNSSLRFHSSSYLKNPVYDTSMKCPQCEAENTKSTVRDFGGSRTQMGRSLYYDEDGQHHVHDPNRSTYKFYCSNGHEFQVSSRDGCHVAGCSFLGDQRITVTEKKIPEPSNLVIGEAQHLTITNSPDNLIIFTGVELTHHLTGDPIPL